MIISTTAGITFAIGIALVIGSFLGFKLAKSDNSKPSVKVTDSIDDEAVSTSPVRKPVLNSLLTNKSHLTLYQALSDHYLDSHNISIFLPSCKIDLALPDILVPFTLVCRNTGKPLLCILFTKQAIFNDTNAVNIINLRNGLMTLEVKSVLIPDTPTLHIADILESIDAQLFTDSIF